MALTDNLIVLAQPASGDTFLKNLIDDTNLLASGAGTESLVNDAGLYGWNVQGARNGTFLGGASYEGGAITVAVRFKCVSRAADFAQYLGVGTATSSYYGAQITNNGTSTGNLRARESIAGSGFTVIGTTAYVTGDYITLVIRLCDNGFSFNTSDVFLKQTSRVNNNPDLTVAATAATRSGTIDDLLIGATGTNLTFVDLAVWMRALTNAEGAQVGDDIRGALNPSSTLNITAANTTGVGESGTGVIDVDPPEPGTINLAGSNTTGAGESGTGIVDIDPAMVTITTDQLYNYNNIRQETINVPRVLILSMTGTVILSLTDQVTNSIGKLVISSVSLVSGTDYMVALWDATDTNANTMKRGFKKHTAI